MKHVKYPRTYHFPFSLGLQNNDKLMENKNCFNGKNIAVTIKMDGENTSLYRDGLHARSLSSTHHSSRSWIKGLHGQIKNLIPNGWRICGENMYAKHSIYYENLESYFYVFNIWNNNICISLKETIEICKDLGLIHVPILDIFDFKDFELIESWYNYTINEIKSEGIVVRNVNEFKYEDFSSNVVKAVRPNHIQTDEHWTKNWIPNKLL